ncbi:hypothetical protein GXM23_02480 [Akkermansia muciniphila]|nr:hypothetical protein [Akkermansia muciniphila]QIA35333.1 hypothetical protein GXM23_02480 [Akkermansia muciniphila]
MNNLLPAVGKPGAFPYIVKSILSKQREGPVNSARDFRKTEAFLFKNQV